MHLIVFVGRGKLKECWSRGVRVREDRDRHDLRASPAVPKHTADRAAALASHPGGLLASRSGGQWRMDACVAAVVVASKLGGPICRCFGGRRSAQIRAGSIRHLDDEETYCCSRGSARSGCELPCHSAVRSANLSYSSATRSSRRISRAPMHICFPFARVASARSRQYFGSLIGSCMQR